MIEDIINNITIAKNNGAYIAALALALTLPNVFSNIEYNKKTCGNEYVEWFNKWVYPYYEQPKSSNPIINQGIEKSKFDTPAFLSWRTHKWPQGSEIQRKPAWEEQRDRCLQRWI